jgi:ABC-type branched-subunit amino acid transport system permease subunit
MSPTNSIEVAVVVSAVRHANVCYLPGSTHEELFTVAFPSIGCSPGLLFIVVTLFLPKGVIGLQEKREQ